MAGGRFCLYIKIIERETTLTSLKRIISKGEIEKYSQGLKNNKAVGIDTFPYEFYRNGEEWKIEEIYIIFKAIFKEARPPNEWNKYTIKLIHKGGNKNKQDIENYHPIALINTICKILCGIVNIGITEVLEKNCLL